MQTSRKAKAPTSANVEAQSLIPQQIGIKSMKNDISVLNKSQLTMSSREIAELTNKEHKNVLRVIRELISAQLLDAQIEPLKFEYRNQWFDYYELNKRDSLVIVARLSPEFMAFVVDRWQELEEQVNSNSPILPDFNDPVKAARAWADEREQTILLTHKVEELEPKAEFHDKVTSSKDAISLAQAAKTLGTGRNRLCALLRQNKWLRRNNEPYQDKIEQGLLDVKLTNWEHPDNGLQQSVTALVTGKGLTKISQMLTAH